MVANIDRSPEFQRETANWEAYGKLRAPLQRHAELEVISEGKFNRRGIRGDIGAIYELVIALKDQDQISTAAGVAVFWKALSTFKDVAIKWLDVRADNRIVAIVEKERIEFRSGQELKKRLEADDISNRSEMGE